MMPDANGFATPTTAPVAVRRAGAEDLGGAVPLFDAYRQFYGAAPDLVASHGFLATRLAQGESVVLLASFQGTGGGASIGFAQLYHGFSSVSLSRIVILNDLFVVPAWRRAGVARRLVDSSAAYAREYGAIRLELATQRTNQPALHLYRSLGFVPDTEFTHMSLLLDAAPSISKTPRPHQAESS